MAGEAAEGTWLGWARRLRDLRLGWSWARPPREASAPWRSATGTGSPARPAGLCRPRPGPKGTDSSALAWARCSQPPRLGAAREQAIARQGRGGGERRNAPALGPVPGGDSGPAPGRGRLSRSSAQQHPRPPFSQEQVRAGRQEGRARLSAPPWADSQGDPTWVGKHQPTLPGSAFTRALP